VYFFIQQEDNLTKFERCQITDKCLCAPFLCYMLDRGGWRSITVVVDSVTSQLVPSLQSPSQETRCHVRSYQTSCRSQKTISTSKSSSFSWLFFLWKNTRASMPAIRDRGC